MKELKLTIHIKYRFIPWLIKPYYYLFTVIFWQPFIWNRIKPKNGIIDNKAHWFHRHSVTCLNKVRDGDSWVMIDLLGLIIREPHAHIENQYFYWSKKHLFVIRKNK